MKRETHVLTVALLSAICISGFAFVPTVAAVISPIVPSATPSPRKKATPRPIQSPVTTRTNGVQVNQGVEDDLFSRRKRARVQTPSRSTASPQSSSPTQSPRKKATPRPTESPVTKRTSANTNIGTGNQVESARTQSTPSAVRTRTETVDKDETITIHQRKTPTAGNQPGVQQRRRTNTATPKSQPRAVKKNQDIEVENDETHLAPRTSTGSGSATPTQIPAQNVMNKNCQEFEAVRNDRTRNQTSGGSTNTGPPKSSVKRSKPRRQ